MTMNMIILVVSPPNFPSLNIVNVLSALQGAVIIFFSGHPCIVQAVSFDQALEGHLGVRIYLTASRMDVGAHRTKGLVISEESHAF